MLKLDLPTFGQDLKKKLENIIEMVLKSKITFAVLVLAFIAISLFLIYNQNRVKGTTDKAYTVVIWIDNSRVTVKTSAENPEVILRDNNIALYPEDILTTDLILDPVNDGGAGQKIVIKRAPVYYVSVDGGVKEIRMWDPVVSEILKKSAVVIGPKDLISETAEKILLPGTTIVITRVKQADVDVFEEIPFNTINRGDASIAFGSQRIIQGGITGKLKKTYRITYNNGIEVSRVFLYKETVVAKKDKIVASGIITGQSKWGPYYETNYGPYTTSLHFKGYVGKYILITNLANNKKVKVKVVDSGPTDALLDLSTTAFREIGGSTFHGHIDAVSVQLVD